MHATVRHFACVIVRKPGRSVLVFGAAVSIAFWLLLGDAYTPYKDEVKYILNARAWLRGEPSPSPAYSPVHAIPAAMISDTLWDAGNTLRFINCAAMVLSGLLFYLIARRLGLGRVVSVVAPCIWMILTGTLVAGTGMLAEPMATALFLAGFLTLVSLNSVGWRGIAAGLLFGASSALRIEYIGYAMACLALWAVFDIRKRGSSAVLAVITSLGVFLVPPLVDSLLGAEFSIFRHHHDAEKEDMDTGSVLIRYVTSWISALTPNAWRQYPYPFMIASLAGMALLVFRKVKNLSMMVALFGSTSLTLSLVDVRSSMNAEQMYARYIYLFSGVGCLFAVWTCRRLPKFKTLRMFGVLLLAALAIGLLVNYFSDLGKRWPIEYRELRQWASLPKGILATDVVLAQRTAVGLYIDRPIDKAFGEIPENLSPIQFLEFCVQENINVVIVQERWTPGYGASTWAIPALEGGHPGFYELFRWDEQLGRRLVVLKRAAKDG